MAKKKTARKATSASKRSSGKRGAKQPDLSGIAPGLRSLAFPIADLVPDPRNAKLHGERNLAAITASYRNFGQQKNIVAVAGTNIVIAGNGQLAAATSLGWTHIAVNFFPDEASARAYALADNRTSEIDVAWDPALLQTSIEEIQAADADFDLGEIGFDSSEIDRMVEGLGSKAKGQGRSAAAEAAPEVTEDERPVPPAAEPAPATHACPKCGHTWSGDSPIDKTAKPKAA